MKPSAFIALIALATSMSAFANNPMKHERGMVIIEESSGEDISYENGSFSRVPLESIVKSTVLKIKGKDRYILAETLDVSTGAVSKSVNIENFDLSEEINKAVKEGNATIDSNGTALIDLKMEFKDEDTQVKISVKGAISGVCDSHLNTSTDYVFAKKDDKPEQTIKDVRLVADTHCNGVLSKAELKAIDLKSVMVCDERAEEVKCDDKKDMSFLTFDL